jgi:hypothetical protein
LAQRLQLSQAESIVFVGLVFRLLELPGLAGGIGDLAGQAEFAAEIKVPSGRGTSLDDHERGPVPLDQPQ